MQANTMNLSIPPREIQSLIPHLSQTQRKELLAYRTFFESYIPDLTDWSKEELEKYPAFAGMLKILPEKIVKAMSRLHNTLEKEAIYSNRWEPYIDNLIYYGIQYALMGFDFKGWYDILSLLRGHLEPLIREKCKHNVEEAFEVLRGMNTFHDIVMSTIGEAYIFERNRIIEMQKNQFEEKLVLESKKRLYTIVDSAQDAIITTDSSGNILLWNKGARDLFGYTMEEAMGQPLTIIMPERHKSIYQNGIKHFIDTGISKILGKPIEMTGLTKDGIEFPVELIIGSWQSNAESFFCGIIRDITNRKKAEEEKARLQALEERNKELENFAYIISHDLKTPLRGISTVSEWVLHDYKDKLDSQGQEYLELLKNRVARLEEQINGVLTYSRVGRTDSPTEKIDFNTIVHDVIEMIMPAENVKITIDNKLPSVSASPVEMQQLMTYLIDNAIKHNDKKEIKINIGCTPERDFWKFYVKDNGPGIEKAFHEKVFKIFQTLKPKDETGSTGIGLAVAKKILEGGGGKIWIESEKGQGTTFFFLIRK